MAPQTEFVFSTFRLDAINDRLSRDGKAIRLTPKAFSVLRYLAEHSDQLVTKEVLLKTLWPNISVTDAVLTVCIGEIRKALDTPEIKAFLPREALDPVASSPEELSALLKREIEKYAKVIRLAGIRVE